MPKRYMFNHHGKKMAVSECALPFKIEGVYCRFLRLSQGQISIIDAEDYLWASRYVWHARWNPCTQSFYAGRKEDLPSGKQITIGLHREILGLTYGDRRIAEHANCISLDCRRKNLRIATHAQNMQNMRMVKRNNSGYKGVSQHADGRHWMGRFSFNGKQIYVGFFDNPSTADKAVREERERVCGKFARHK